jgi:hypothetical protein
VIGTGTTINPTKPGFDATPPIPRYLAKIPAHSIMIIGPFDPLADRGEIKRSFNFGIVKQVFNFNHGFTSFALGVLTAPNPSLSWGRVF